MLGAVKGDVEQPGASLFRVLSSRWTPLAPMKQQPRLIASRAGDGSARPSRAWIGKPRWRNVPEIKSVKTWNPWLWMK
jgi:hypothetical protein